MLFVFGALGQICTVQEPAKVLAGEYPLHEVHGQRADLVPARAAWDGRNTIFLGYSDVEVHGFLYRHLQAT